MGVLDDLKRPGVVRGSSKTGRGVEFQRAGGC